VIAAIECDADVQRPNGTLGSLYAGSVEIPAGAATKLDFKIIVRSTRHQRNLDDIVQDLERD
jgi:hypothetical protein